MRWKVSSKSLCYLAMIICGYVLTLLMPLTEVIGLTPFCLMCAMFINVFGLKKILVIYFLPATAKMVIYFNALRDSVIPTVKLLNWQLRDMGSPFRIDPELYFWSNIITAYVVYFATLIIAHYILNKAGAFNRIGF